MQDLHAAFTVRAPASSANLGPGFDCAAVALDLWNDVHVTPGRGRFDIRGEGEDDPTLSGDSNLVLKLFRHHGGEATQHVDVRCINRVPLARGLGSSSAAAAVGIVAGWTCAGRPWTAHDLFTEIAGIDGHPDNAAAVAYGGVNWCTPNDMPWQLTRDIELTPICVIPHRPLPTIASRNVVPQTATRTRAAAHAAAAGMLAAGFATGRLEWLRGGMKGDMLHESARAELVPELAQLRQWCASHASVVGVTLSGAGSTVVVWTLPSAAHDLSGALEQFLGDTADVMISRITPCGTHVVEAS